MTKDRTFTNISVNRKKIEKYKKAYEKFDVDQTFNIWLMDCAGASLDKMKYLKVNYPDYKFEKCIDDNGFAIIDTSKDEIFRISVEGSRLICSKDGTAQCDHKSYAAFHPQFTAGKK